MLLLLFLGVWKGRVQKYKLTNDRVLQAHASKQTRDEKGGMPCALPARSKACENVHILQTGNVPFLGSEAGQVVTVHVRVRLSEVVADSGE